MKRKYKDLCDACNENKYDCHGYDGYVLCPECATKLGYKLWKDKETRKEEQDMDNEVVVEEKYFENGNHSITTKKEENGIKVRFFENGQIVKEHTYNSDAGVYKAKKNWLKA
ncbi:MAG: hypothetical protein KBT03_07640 [Bacteroidales bacterium]|nr:hypothetical protein [Candidatus Scybalousia scybalohippi]